MENDRIVCPWCQTEIVWDEEIGPERYCPHCENELSGYRTVQIGIDDENDEDAEEDDDEPADWADESDAAVFRGRSRAHLAMEEMVERILDLQDEAPECPSCREYMLEAGAETVSEAAFVPAIPQALGVPILTAPFRIVRYVCPSCFHVDSKLDKGDQERLAQTLAKAADAAPAGN